MVQQIFGPLVFTDGAFLHLTPGNKGNKANSKGSKDKSEDTAMSFSSSRDRDGRWDNNSYSHNKGDRDHNKGDQHNSFPRPLM